MAAEALADSKDWIHVSHEMAAFVGAGAIDAARCPAGDSLAIGFSLRSERGAVVVLDGATSAIESADVALVVTREAVHRLFGAVPDHGAFHLPAELKAIVLAIRDCGKAEPVRTTLRLARSIELLCAALDQIAAGVLVPAGGGAFSERDAQRLIAARQIIEDRWSEKLTLDGIARACGLNRAKLTRGFRDMFSCTIGDALAERRLGGAKQMLLATDLPVSSIGYRCGYLNNASFTRAFSRRYGVAPTQLRSAGGMQ